MQQWGVGIGECGRGGTAAAKVDCSGNAGGGTDLLTEAGWPALEGGNMDGPEEQGAARGGSWDARSCQARQEVEGPRMGGR